MYENIKYEDLKQLPDDQKKIALQELMAEYGSNKAIAEAIGGATIAISNLYGKFVEGKHLGREKGSKNTVENKPEVVVSEQKTKRQYTRRTATEQPENNAQQKLLTENPLLKKLSTASFTTNLSGELLGEEAKERIIGMANALLNNKTYNISIQISEQ